MSNNVSSSTQEIIDKYEKQIKELNVFMDATITSILKEKEKTEEDLKTEIIKLRKKLQKLEVKADPFLIVNIQDQEELEDTNKDLSDMVKLLKEEVNKDMIEIDGLNKNIEELNKNIEELNQKLKTEIDQKQSLEKVSVEVNKKNKENEDVIESQKNEIKNLHTQLEEIKKQNEEITKCNKELEEKNNSLLEYIQKINTKSVDLMKKKHQEEEEIKAKANSEPILSKKEQEIINEIIGDYLAKIKVSEYSLSLFDIIEQICVNIDKFDEICNNNSNSVNNIFINTYNDIKFYYFLNNDIKSPQDLYKEFIARYSSTINKNLDQSIIDIVTKVKTLTSKDNTILEKYRTKREKLNTSAAVSFGIITNYIAKKYSKEQFITKDIITLFRRESNNLIIDYPAYFTILEKEHINVFGDNHMFLYSYYAQTVLPKEKKISILFSPMNSEVDINTLFYFISLYCYNLTSLSLVYQKHENDNQQSSIYKYVINILPFVLKSLSINELILEGISIPKESISTLSKALETTKIASLSLDGALSQDVIPYLSNYLLNNNGLIKLNLSNNPYNLPTFYLSSLLTLSKLVFLNLSYCSLSEQDFESISTLLQQNTSIISLDLSNNNISLKGCSLLCFALKKNKTLIKISLNDCNLNDESLLMLFENTGQSLQSIILNNNKLKNTGLIGLTNFLITNRVLGFLSLQNCDIGDDGVKTFITTIIMSKSPKLVVHFENNQITDKELFTILSKNKDFFAGRKEFYFSESCIKKDIIKDLKTLDYVKIV